MARRAHAAVKNLILKFMVRSEEMRLASRPGIRLRPT
jgi:hypothetical protein